MILKATSTITMSTHMRSAANSVHLQSPGFRSRFFIRFWATLSLLWVTSTSSSKRSSKPSCKDSSSLIVSAKCCSR